MIRYIALAALIIMCITSNSTAANINAPHKSAIITKNSDTYKDINQWLQVYCKDKYKEEMRNDGKIEIIDVTRIIISPNENTYFVDFRGSLFGKMLIKQNGSSFKLLLEGRLITVLNNNTNGFKDIVESSPSGAYTAYENYYKYNGNEYQKTASAVCGYNTQLDNDLKQYAKIAKKSIITYKSDGESNIVKSGNISGRIVKILASKTEKNYKLVIIEDNYKDLISLLTTNAGAKYITSKYKDYKSRNLKFQWKSLFDTSEQAMDIMMLITNVSI